MSNKIFTTVKILHECGDFPRAKSNFYNLLTAIAEVSFLPRILGTRFYPILHQNPIFYFKKQSFTGINQSKHSQQNTFPKVFFNRVAGRQLALLWKKRRRHRCFSMSFEKS